ncbi:MAG: hypothetical protein WCO28_00710 [Bacteroidota bacterium]
MYIIIFVSPSVLLAQPTFGSGGLCDTCTPIDQQSIMLASGGVIYAIHKIRESRKK